MQNGAQGGYLEHKGLQLLAVFQMPGLGPHAKGSAPLQPNITPGWEDPGKCGQTPLQQQSVSSQHFLSGPKPKLTQ